MFDPSVPQKTEFSPLNADTDSFEATQLAGLSASAGDVDEQRRQQILQSYRLVDTEPEPAFEDIVNMAALICGTPIAMVTLITEDRQWFKARVGLDLKETPRAHAFCAHAIRNPSRIMAVQDARQDARFMHNPLVVGDPGIRFYAGAPLLSPSGVALGTVCVIDRVPRELTPAMTQGLQALARQAGELLALRRANSDLETLNQSVMEMQVAMEQQQLKLAGENTALASSSPLDAVTGLSNQRSFEHFLNEELRRAERTQGSLAVLVAQIDQWDAFARDFGASAANEALRRVAKAFKAQARSYNTLAILSSHRFAMLLPGTVSAELDAVGQRMRRAVEALAPLGRALQVSVGVTEAHAIDAPLDVMQRVTAAVEQASAQGGNQVVVAT